MPEHQNAKSTRLFNLLCLKVPEWTSIRNGCFGILTYPPTERMQRCLEAELGYRLPDTVSVPKVQGVVDSRAKEQWNRTHHRLEAAPEH